MWQVQSYSRRTSLNYLSLRGKKIRRKLRRRNVNRYRLLSFKTFIEPMIKVEKKCWDILEVMSMNGCENACATNVH